MTNDMTREPQYQAQVELRDTIGLAKLGLTTNQVWQDDPRHLLFILARYKFVSKMLRGKKRVLEVGCGDAFGTRMVQQEVGHITALDFDPVFVEDAKSRMDDRWKFDCLVHDMLSAPPPGGPFDAAYSLDVIEHIQQRDEDTFIGNIVKTLVPDGVLIVGSPSLQSQLYASKYSKMGHVNCKDQPTMQALMDKYFRNVFIFSVNDEMVHTGYYPMAHYLMALCVGVR